MIPDQWSFQADAKSGIETQNDRKCEDENEPMRQSNASRISKSVDHAIKTSDPDPS